MPSEFLGNDVLIQPFGFIFNFYLVQICRVRDLEQFYFHFEKLGKLIISKSPHQRTHTENESTESFSTVYPWECSLLPRRRPVK
jgi:hypothetical protein